MIFKSYDQVPARKKRIADGLENRPEILATKSKEIQTTGEPMSSGFTGIKLNFSDSGEVKIISGEKIMPHRCDLIEELLNSGKIKNLPNMFFKFDTPKL